MTDNKTATTGDGSTGNWSTGNRSTGNWSTGDRSTGWFCTDEPDAVFFNKAVEGKKMSDLLCEIDLPYTDGFVLTRWIATEDMTPAEKKSHTEHVTTGGYLKTYTYHEAWANFWALTPDDNKARFLALPNFDAAIFLGITGIDVRTKDTHLICIDGVQQEITAEQCAAIKRSIG